jgi:hypothetical protein
MNEQSMDTPPKYEKPRVERFGTFRELTQTGTAAGGDGCIVLDPGPGEPVDNNPDDGISTPTLPGCGSGSGYRSG